MVYVQIEAIAFGSRASKHATTKLEAQLGHKTHEPLFMGLPLLVFSCCRTWRGSRRLRRCPIISAFLVAAAYLNQDVRQLRSGWADMPARGEEGEVHGRRSVSERRRAFLMNL